MTKAAFDPVRDKPRPSEGVKKYRLDSAVPIDAILAKLIFSKL